MLLDAVSTALVSESPLSALKINPLNSPARINAIETELSDLTEATPEQISQLRKYILNGIRLSPIDARYYSALGIVDSSTGNLDQAKQLFSHSLKMLPTEIQALSHQLVFSVQDRRFIDAVDYLELIARRWPRYWGNVAPALSILLADQEAHDIIAKRFSTSPNLRRMLVNILAQSPDTIAQAMNLLLDWHKEEIPDLASDINTVTSRLIGAKRPSEAFLLFNLTRSPSAPNGYVYNGQFNALPSGNPFDWNWRSQAGADIRIVKHSETRRDSSNKGQVPADEKSLSIRFLDNPVRFDNVRQMTRLVAGKYSLAAAYSVRNLRTPKPLMLGIRCAGARQFLASQTFRTDINSPTKLEVEFIVPPTNCDLQQITVYNENLTDSWKNRYSGSLFLHSVAITRSGA